MRRAPRHHPIGTPVRSTNPKIGTTTATHTSVAAGPQVSAGGAAGRGPCSRVSSANRFRSAASKGSTRYRLMFSGCTRDAPTTVSSSSGVNRTSFPLLQEAALPGVFQAIGLSPGNQFGDQPVVHGARPTHSGLPASVSLVTSVVNCRFQLGSYTAHRTDPVRVARSATARVHNRGKGFPVGHHTDARTCDGEDRPGTRRPHPAARGVPGQRVNDHAHAPRPRREDQPAAHRVTGRYTAPSDAS